MFTIITKIKKRDGREVVFDSEKIRSAIKKAFLASNILDEKIFDSLTEQSLKILESKYENTIPTVENVQDIVENIIILNNYASVAKSYILYREKHKEIRAKKILEEIKEKKLNIKKQDGSLELFDQSKINKKIENISSGLSGIDFDAIAKEVSKTIYNEVPIKEIKKSVLNAVKLKIEKHYNYSYLASRLLLDQLYQDIIGKEFQKVEQQ